MCFLVCCFLFEWVALFLVFVCLILFNKVIFINFCRSFCLFGSTNKWNYTICPVSCFICVSTSSNILWRCSLSSCVGCVSLCGFYWSGSVLLCPSHDSQSFFHMCKDLFELFADFTFTMCFCFVYMCVKVVGFAEIFFCFIFTIVLSIA